MNQVVKLDGGDQRIARLDRSVIEALHQTGVLDTLGRLELVSGVLIETSPAGLKHSRALFALNVAIDKALKDRFGFAVDLGVFFDQFSMRAPDLCFVRKDAPDGFADAKHIFLAIEIADASLRGDLSSKAALYGSHGLPEYWVVDLPNRKLHVHRAPGEAGYLEVAAQDWSTPVSPLCAPDVSFILADILKDIA